MDPIAALAEGDGDEITASCRRLAGLDIHNDDETADAAAPTLEDDHVDTLVQQEQQQQHRGRKQHLKRWLRLAVRARKMEWRYRKTVEHHADNEAAVTAARAAWDEALAAVDAAAAIVGGCEVASVQRSTTSSTTTSTVEDHAKVDEWLARARRQIEDIYHALQRALPKTDNPPPHPDNNNQDEEGDDNPKNHPPPLYNNNNATAIDDIKLHRHLQARTLLLHMTHGTQQRDMFHNTAALRGYTKQKFIPRAILVTSTLAKLYQSSASNEAACRVLRAQVAAVDTVVSIGCGPGCDVLGAAAWLDALQSTSTSTSTPRPYRRAVLMDFALSNWQDVILDTLHPLLQPAVYDHVDYAHCDVTAPWQDAVNATARQCLFSTQNNGGDTTHGKNHQNHSNGGKQLQENDNDAPSSSKGVTLIITSYLLSETRGKWAPFYASLWQAAAPGTLFLFSDPTAWQVRQWLQQRLANDTPAVVYTWLDSSMHHAALQELEKRVGPAALLAMKPMAEINMK